MSSKPTRWGLVSAGLISWDFANALSTDGTRDRHNIVAVAARSLERAEEFAKCFDIPKAYGSYEELAKDPDVEIVYVGSVNQTHLPVCHLMLLAGKPVLCEKPLAVNVRETKDILEEAKKSGLFFMEAMWARTQPAYNRLKIELETIGKVYSCHASFGQKFDSDRIREKELGGGTVLDLGVYAVYFAQLVFGGEKPLKVAAAGHLNKEGTDESVAAVLIYSGGRTATFSTSCKVVLGCEAEVFGTSGKLKLGYPFWCSQSLTSADGSTKEFPLPKNERYPEKWNFWNSASLAYEADHVRECLHKGLLESPLVTHAESLTVAEILEEVRKQVGVTYPQDN